MGMRTIRWRNGQCPGRNGQWAERIAHAGSEAVRLVPFCEAEELSSASIFFLIAEYCVSAWRLPLCRDAGRIKISEQRAAIAKILQKPKTDPPNQLPAVPEVAPT